MQFGNENEARAFAKSEGWETEDVEEIALRVRETRNELCSLQGPGQHPRTRLGLGPRVIVLGGVLKDGQGRQEGRAQVSLLPRRAQCFACC